MLTQTWALIAAAYRELNAKKLFWITMGINLLVVVLFASLGINSQGVTLLHWSFSNEFMNTEFVQPDMFYRLQFISWGIPIWLTWVATILALVSTAGLVPDLIRGGTVETMLSKPISRSRLFLTKYMTGLLFVVLQVFVFSLGCFLVIGIRGGAWDFRLFLAVPIILVFFSYLYSVCAVFGMITKSTITALLLTMVIWFLLFTTNAADAMLIAQREGVALKVEDLEERESNQAVLRDRAAEQVIEFGPDTAMGQRYAQAVVDRQEGLDNAQADLVTQRASLKSWTKWASLVNYTRTVLPKTGETIKLLDRYIMSAEEMASLMMERNGIEMEPDQNQPAFADPRVAARVAEAQRDRSVLWIVGTSLLFEAVLLLIATMLFARRDF